MLKGDPLWTMSFRNTHLPPYPPITVRPRHTCMVQKSVPAVLPSVVPCLAPFLFRKAWKEMNKHKLPFPSIFLKSTSSLIILSWIGFYCILCSYWRRFVLSCCSCDAHRKMVRLQSPEQEERDSNKMSSILTLPHSTNMCFSFYLWPCQRDFLSLPTLTAGSRTVIYLWPNLTDGETCHKYYNQLFIPLIFQPSPDLNSQQFSSLEESWILQPLKHVDPLIPLLIFFKNTL